ncbi:MAG: alanyl-tRNA editing protein [Acidimicrobiia bacterium]|nr:alanyl-tRNA editing protein [Acidimicrobiia bacterium]
MSAMVFWDDPYLPRLATAVSSVDGEFVSLAETNFFAFAGGQERDHGTIGGHEVLDARWDGPTIIYRLPRKHGLSVGDEVEAVIDHQRRDRLRRLHMATEIVLELLTKSHPHLVKVGAHMSAEKGRIDFATEHTITDWLVDVAKTANQMIEADIAIERSFLEGSTTRRYWKIPGFAKVPCGGTLPERTSEIGPIDLRRSNPGKGKERVEITLTGG